MISLWLLDDANSWTVLGNIIKYAIVLGAVATGFALFLRSKTTYFALGLAVVLIVPLLLLSGADRWVKLEAAPNEWRYVAVGVALLECFIIWIPILGFVLRERDQSGLAAAPHRGELHTCPSCGSVVFPGATDCSRCGRLVFVTEPPKPDEPPV